jgi:hypothetical protein
MAKDIDVQQKVERLKELMNEVDEIMVDIMFSSQEGVPIYQDILMRTMNFFATCVDSVMSLAAERIRDAYPEEYQRFLELRENEQSATTIPSAETDETLN